MLKDGVAHLAAEQPADVLCKLDWQWLIQTQVSTQTLQLGRRRVRAKHNQDWIARREVNERERHQRHAKQHDYAMTLLFEEIVPVLEGRCDKPAEFARQTVERFRNPFLRHKLADIALHHAAKRLLLGDLQLALALLDLPLQRVVAHLDRRRALLEGGLVQRRARILQ